MFTRQPKGLPAGGAASHLGRCGRKTNKPPVGWRGLRSGTRGRVVPRSEVLGLLVTWQGRLVDLADTPRGSEAGMPASRNG